MTYHSAMIWFGWIVSPTALVYAIWIQIAFMREEYKRIVKEVEDEARAKRDV